MSGGQIDRSKVTRVYFGRPGCCCGCRGNYHETPRMIARAVSRINSVLADPGGEHGWQLDDGPNYVAVERGNCITIAYFD